VIINDLLNHVTNREWFAAAATSIARLKPVEAAKRVVDFSLLRIQECYPAFVGESRPA
jgi:hypothetical protein